MVPIETGIPALGTIVAGFATVCALFVLRVVMKTEQKLTEMWTALFGVHDAREPTGIVYESRQIKESMQALGENFRVHVAEEQEWQASLNRGIAKSATEMREMVRGVEVRIGEVKTSVEQRAQRRRA